MPRFNENLPKMTSDYLTQPMLSIPTTEQYTNPKTKQIKCADVFSFDDMLASCVAEIIKNGIETQAIPDTIKDWIGGKLLRAFPQQLTTRLLNFMMENRDFDGLLAFRECRTADVPEFTLLLHRNQTSRQNNPDGSKSEQPTIFDDAKITTDGGKFFSNEMLVDEGSIVPTKYPLWTKKPKLDDLPPMDPKDVKIIKKSASRSKLTPYDLENSFRDDMIETIESESDNDLKNNPEFTRQPVKPRKLTGKKLGRPVIKGPNGKDGDFKCHVCESAFNTNSSLAKHYKYKHPNVINPHTATFHKLNEESKMLKNFPEIYHDPENGYR